MLAKTNRMDKKTVSMVFKEGKSKFSPFFSLKYVLINNSKRISFVAPKTVSKKATVRNLLRRRGYSVIRKILPLLPNGFNGVFIFNKKCLPYFGVRKNSNNNPILNIENELGKIIDKIN